MADMKSYDELIKLKELLDMGIISADEFNAKKMQILGLNSSSTSEPIEANSELFACPGCGKKVSKRASTCPGCGYPIAQYIQEQEEKEEEEREAKRVEAILQSEDYINLSKVNQYYIGKHVLSLSVNDVKCQYASVMYQQTLGYCSDTVIEYCKENDLFYGAGETITSYQELSEYHSETLADMIFSGLVDTCIKLEEVVNGRYDNDEYIEAKDRLFNEFDFDGLRGSIYDFYQKVCLKVADVVGESKAEYNSAKDDLDNYSGPIDGVFSSSFSGLLTGSIKASLINGAASGLHSGWNSRNVERKFEEYKKTYNSVHAKAAEIISKFVLNQAEVLCADFLECTLNFMKKEFYVSEIRLFNLNDEQIDKNMSILKDITESRENIEQAAYEILKKKFIDPSVYLYLFTNGRYTNDDILKCFELLHFVNVYDSLIESIKEKKYMPLACGNQIKTTNPRKVYDSLGVALEELYKALDICDQDQVLIEYKDKINVTYEKNYKKALDKFMKCDSWFNQEVFSEEYSNFQKCIVPEDSDCQSSYEGWINWGTIVQNELADVEAKKYSSLASKMIDAKKTVTKYTLSEIQNKEEKIYKKYKLNECAQENELPIILIKAYPNKLLITTRSFYLISNETNKLIHKFAIDDIESVHYSTNGFTTSQHFHINLENEGFEIFNSNFPQEDIPYLTRFANTLIGFVNEGETQANRNIQQIVKNTDIEKLAKEYISRQVEIISFVDSLLDDYYKRKDDYVGRFSFEIPYQEGGLRSFIKSQGIGNEYIIWNDQHHMVTDQAFYYSEAYGFYGNTQADRYVYSDYDEIVATQSCDSFLGTTKIGFFTIENKKETLHVIGEDYKDYIRILSAIIAARENISSKKVKFLLGKKYIYCMECKKFSFVNIPDEEKRCPNCHAKLSKSGMMTLRGDCVIGDDCNISAEGKKDIESRLATFVQLAQKELSNSERVKIDERKKKSNPKSIIKQDNEVVPESDITESNNTNLKDLIVCPECQNKVKKGTKSCGLCGYTFRRICPNCKSEVSSTAKFCNFCGSNMLDDEKNDSKKYCSNCGKEISKTAKFCAFCGTKVNTDINNKIDERKFVIDDDGTNIEITVNSRFIEVNEIDNHSFSNRFDITKIESFSMRDDGVIEEDFDDYESYVYGIGDYVLTFLCEGDFVVFNFADVEHRNILEEALTG